MYLENSEEIIHLKKGDTLYQIHPENKETGEAKSHVKRVVDEKLNIGEIKYASLKTKFGSDDVFVIISMISAAILCLLIIYWAVITMIIGGRIFYGGLIITAVIVLWKFLSTLIMYLLKSIRLFFYKIAIRSS